MQISSLLTIAAMVVLMLWPIIVPALITAGHAILGPDRGTRRAVRDLQPAAD